MPRRPRRSGCAEARLGAAAALALTASLLAMLALPSFASTQPSLDRTVRDVLQSIQQTLGDATSGVTGDHGRRGPRQATPGSGGYQPPLHGDNPHGQGSPAVVDLTPGETRPLGPNPNGTTPGATEEVVVGRARGEQQPSGDYHGHVTVVALFGNEIIGRDTNEGETRAGPLDALQQGLLNPLCDGTANQVCLEVLAADSTTTDSGSTNRFSAANAQLFGPTGISANVVESNGNIASDGTCQTSQGNSRVAGTTIGGSALADVSQSSTESRSCSDGTQTQTNSSSVIGVGGSGMPIPAAGCADGTPDTLTGLPPLAPIVCNADDTNGQGEPTAQAGLPYGVRDALTVFVLDAGGTALTRATTAGSESRAQAPAAPPTPPAPPTPTPPRSGDDGGGGGGGGDDDSGRPEGGGGGVTAAGAPECSDGVDNDGDGRIDFPDDPQCESRADDSEADGNLASTGTDLVTMMLLALVALLTGLGARSASLRLE